MCAVVDVAEGFCERVADGFYRPYGAEILVGMRSQGFTLGYFLVHPSGVRRGYCARDRKVSAPWTTSCARCAGFGEGRASNPQACAVGLPSFARYAGWLVRAATIWRAVIWRAAASWALISKKQSPLCSIRDCAPGADHRRARKIAQKTTPLAHLGPVKSRLSPRKHLNREITCNLSPRNVKF